MLEFFCDEYIDNQHEDLHEHNLKLCYQNDGPNWLPRKELPPFDLTCAKYIYFFSLYWPVGRCGFLFNTIAVETRRQCCVLFRDLRAANLQIRANTENTTKLAVASVQKKKQSVKRLVMSTEEVCMCFCYSFERTETL